MISRSVAILLAILGLYLSAFAAAAQPRGGGGGWRGGGAPAFARGGGFGGGGRFGGGMGGYGRGFGPPQGGGYGRGFGPPQGGFGGYPQAFGGRGYPGSGAGYGAPPPRAYSVAPGPGRGFGGNWGAEQDEVRRAVREGRHIPLGQAIEAVRRRTPGRELDAGLEAGPDGRSVYRLRWAGQNGRRQDYIVDAGTGAVLGVRGGP